LLGVVLGAKSNSLRFSEMRKLLDWGFKHYTAPPPTPTPDPVPPPA
jgi:D-alanyl-D-alanine carboxypeptidase